MNTLEEKYIKIKNMAARRIEICKTCEYFYLHTCRKCGCLLAAKTRIKSSACPLEKWMPE